MTLVGLAARNLLRNKARTALTMLGVAIAILTFVMLRTLIYAWTSASEFAQKDRIVTRHKITFVMTLPKRYIDDVRQMPQVKHATWANWFGGKDPKHDREFFGTFAVDSKSYFDVYSEMSLPQGQLEAWKEDRSGAIVGEALAAKMGYKIGDRITLESGIFPTPPDAPWNLTVRGIYTATAKSIDKSSLLFHWDLVNEAQPPNRRDQIGWIVSRVNTPKDAAGIGLAMDKVFDNKDTQTLSQDEGTFNASFLAGVSAILDALNVVALVILVIMALVLGNTVAMGVRERTNEYGVLRAIGFLPKHIVMFIIGEGMLIGLLGGALGLVLAYPFVERGMGRWLEENMGSYFPYFRINPSDAIAGLSLAVLLGALAGMVPAYGASRLKVTDALRRVA